MRTARGLAPMGLADCWCECYDTDKREIVASSACFPVDVTEGLSTDDWQHWRVGDSTSWLQPWVAHAEHHAAGADASLSRDASKVPDRPITATCERGTAGMRGAASVG